MLAFLRTSGVTRFLNCSSCRELALLRCAGSAASPGSASLPPSARSGPSLAPFAGGSLRLGSVAPSRPGPPLCLDLGSPLLLPWPGLGSPCFGSPCFGSPCFGSPCLGWPCLGSPCFSSPCLGSPCFGSPCLGS